MDRYLNNLNLESDIFLIKEDDIEGTGSIISIIDN
jgi:hypothetical protein